MPDQTAVALPPSLVTRIVEYVVDRYPDKSFGYLVAPRGESRPHDFIGFEGNVRNSARWKHGFESRGQYFVDHPDAGFVAAEDESWRVQKMLQENDLHEVAVFHTHRRHPGNFSVIDYDLHTSRFDSMWHLIISLRNPDQPQLRAFSATARGIRELAVHLGSPSSDEPLPPDWREALELDEAGRPRCPDSRTIVRSVAHLAARADKEAYEELVTHGLYRHAEDRYQEFVTPWLEELAGGVFQMGSPSPAVQHFCGETPRHEVALSPFALSRVPVTNRLYTLLVPDHAYPSAEAELPVVGVSWYDAVLFAGWVGCRLPTEAEWEFACGAGSAHDWCCAAEVLPAHSWCSDNAGGRRHPVGTRAPNAWGLYDMHGNVWEWCADTYFPDFYSWSPRRDPFAHNGGLNLAATEHKVSRGGGYLALPEMCRTRFRLHDPAGYSAPDLGFRLARGPRPVREGEDNVPW
ncbi:formylglycine-generating enzyme family protein [Lentzea jiangxiensis]|uniref:Formylglycine-generating enzyme, required for sulfatase activity, contains SUMF1/FGE domain n=1 Tax=Lentzea jiangxiensis TaxID=641025 RepID=A0A1H0SG61_9PSEU|nr:SUMF1/EgtB/PvdO family nonheme iron enzyme [Lentzea jiangxiensis]SDP40238.1 Formylglycine-generating enzyme, required for sulfatase activity, contains SUMF1/FGE domain [Lentzea jiangxiensis]